ncbi:MAG: Unknown protein [uncultured Sulfurovum sp.]|uniref:Uncharacterized protein n=1 Tax=uncultured Sulfurovum sp. TaxID=269237 RepID=A0A6S6UAN4_9BACT|nr:MAG: Unknown protein [uncultured Sulfurovum sp.]
MKIIEKLRFISGTIFLVLFIALMTTKLIFI